MLTELICPPWPPPLPAPLASLSLPEPLFPDDPLPLADWAADWVAGVVVVVVEPSE